MFCVVVCWCWHIYSSCNRSIYTRGGKSNKVISLEWDMLRLLSLRLAKQNLIVRRSLIISFISQLRSNSFYHLHVNYSCRKTTSWYYITSILISWYCWRHHQKSWWMRHLYNNQIIIDHINILGGEFTPLLFFYRLHPFNTPVIRLNFIIF